MAMIVPSEEHPYIAKPSEDLIGKDDDGTMNQQSPSQLFSRGCSPAKIQNLSIENLFQDQCRNTPCVSPNGDAVII